MPRPAGLLPNQSLSPPWSVFKPLKTQGRVLYRSFPLSSFFVQELPQAPLHHFLFDKRTRGGNPGGTLRWEGALRRVLGLPPQMEIPIITGTLGLVGPLPTASGEAPRPGAWPLLDGAAPKRWDRAVAGHYGQLIPNSLKTSPLSPRPERPVQTQLIAFSRWPATTVFEGSENSPGCASRGSCRSLPVWK